MLKILAVLFLIYIFFRAVGVIFRTVLGGSSHNQNTRYQDKTTGKGPGRKGNISVDHNPNKSKGYEGGEYVDYEEVE